MYRTTLAHRSRRALMLQAILLSRFQWAIPNHRSLRRSARRSRRLTRIANLELSSSKNGSLLRHSFAAASSDQISKTGLMRRTIALSIVAVFLCALTATAYSGTAGAQEFFTSPTGSPFGDG